MGDEYLLAPKIRAFTYEQGPILLFAYYLVNIVSLNISQHNDSTTLVNLCLHHKGYLNFEKLELAICKSYKIVFC